MIDRDRPLRRSKLATKRTVYLFILLLAASGALYRTAAPFLRGEVQEQGDSEGPARQSDGQEVELLKVVDGDTLKVRRSGEEVYVRLLRINTPERGEPGHAEATEALARLVAGRSLSLEGEAGKALSRDKYGRLLAYVYADARNLSLAMVASGWTAFYHQYGRGEHAAALEAAEKKAKAEGRGLWAPDYGNGAKTPQ